VGSLIDSSILVAAERAKMGFDRILREHAGEEIAIAAITASELLHGVHRAARPAQRNQREAFVEGILAVVPVLPFDLRTARVHAAIWAQLAGRGITVGAHDLLIAATALAVGFEVATHDKRSFPRIPGLKVREW
jgi:tRNA(fMet)-specific endonuclease VapC